MKKLDKLILSSFIGPFILTFLVVVFILLVQHMLKYFDDIVGKDLDLDVLGMLMFDFAVFMTPIAIPLAVLLSSLMTFGNLGEHFELTAVKSAGISLLRTLYPIFVFVCLLTVLAFYSNNYFVPKAALNAYSLLWDIKQKKPALDLKEGAFYDGIPDLNIKVNEKDPDTGKIKDVIIYDHRNKDGNKQVVLADSGRMYTINNDSYLVLELYSGQFYIEGSANAKTVSAKRTSTKAESLSRAKFDKNKLIFDLSSFDLTRTDKSLFASNRIMRNLGELETDMDSLGYKRTGISYSTFNDSRYFFTFLNEYELPLSGEMKVYKYHKDSLEKIEAEERLRIQNEQEDSIRALGQRTSGNAERTQQSRIAKKQQIERELRNDNLPNAKSFPGNKKISTPSQVRNAKTLPFNKIIPEDRKLANEITKKQKESAGNKIKKRKNPKQDSIRKARQLKRKRKKIINQKKALDNFLIDTIPDIKVLNSAVNTVRQNKSKLHAHITTLKNNRSDFLVYNIQWHKIISNSFACLVMFLIGAPLGAIIKRGGLGVPVLVSIIFFIVFYVFTMIGEKWAKQDMIDPMLGLWSANILLLPIGLFFLRQARNDARLFDADFYNVAIAKIKEALSGRIKKVKKGDDKNDNTGISETILE